MNLVTEGERESNLCGSLVIDLRSATIGNCTKRRASCSENFDGAEMSHGDAFLAFIDRPDLKIGGCEKWRNQEDNAIVPDGNSPNAPGLSFPEKSFSSSSAGQHKLGCRAFEKGAAEVD